MRDEKNSTLCHWGIKGMKWGVRRYQNQDGTLTAAGKTRYASNTGENADDKTGIKHKKRLSDNQKKVLKIGAGVAVSALAVYGSYRLYQSGKLDPFIDEGKQTASRIINEMSQKRNTAQPKNAHPDYISAHEKKSVRELSDAELNAKINRLQKEKQYESMVATPSQMKKIIDTASSTAAALGTISTLYNNYNSVAKIGKKALESKKVKSVMTTTRTSVSANGSQ